jgi:3-hydroxyisobutyrate dehydrogenase-like beta-hydroxyacid dehydrogenase
MLKDLRLVMQLAAATKTPAPMTQNVAQLVSS